MVSRFDSVDENKVGDRPGSVRVSRLDNVVKVTLSLRQGGCTDFVRDSMVLKKPQKLPESRGLDEEH